MQESLDQLDEAPLIQYNLARRQIKPPQRYAHADIVSFALLVIEDIAAEELVIYREAITSNESSQWIGVMNEELKSLYKNRNWELVKPPKGHWLQMGLQKERPSPRVDVAR